MEKLLIEKMLGENLPEKSEAAQRRSRRIAIIFTASLLLGMLVILGTLLIFNPMMLSHPGFDANAEQGAPEVDERYAYSALEMSEDAKIWLCGLPPCDGKNVDLYLTNVEENGVYLRAVLSDKEGNVLGESGVLEPGEYLKTLTLNRQLEERETPVEVKIITYQPVTWQSRGSVNLSMTLYKDWK